MLSKRKVIELMDRRLVRRALTIPVTLMGAFVGLVFSPLILAITAVSDLVAGRRDWPRVRLATLIILALIIETLGIVVALISWVITGFGLLGPAKWRWRVNRPYMGWYTSTMLSMIVRVLGTNIEWREGADLSTGPVVVIARHTSFFDALIPAALVTRRNALLAHHVVTQGLRYAPCIDIVGHRFPNQFIRRVPGAGSRELGPIAKVGSELNERSAAIIFPEGTFRNPDRFARVLRRLRRRQPELADRASKLRHVLPPRSSGTKALLEGAPTADLVVCVNTGLEPFGSIKEIVNRPVADRPVTIKTWRISRAEIPEDPELFDEWLFEQYVAIDSWVESEQAKHPRSDDYR